MIKIQEMMKIMFFKAKKG